MKNLRYLFFVLGAVTLFTFCDNKSNAKESPKLGGWNYDWMVKVKKEIAKNDQEFLPAYNNLLSNANKALEGGVYSVTYKSLTPIGGTKNDYMSMGPYWWPDPTKPDGLPYIRRDGEVNPERDKLDSAQKGKMISAVRSLSLGWFFSENEEYAQKAAELIRVWFLNPETLMNPHLKYGQSIPGITEGRFIGIIDGRSFYDLVDAIALLKMSKVFTPEEETAIKKWFQDYFQWLTESQFGKDEDNYKNNHSVAYDAQATSIAYFIGNDEYVKRKVEEMPSRRIDPMIEADGRQPHELIRTKAFGYSVHNLANFFDTADLGLKVGVDIYHYTNPKGASLKTALDYLIGFIGKEKEWPYEQIDGWKGVENSLGLLVRRAAKVYDDESYKKLWENVFYERMKTDWKILVKDSYNSDL